jgi:predicted phosphatase
MSDKKKRVDPIPEEFANYEEAAAFWDAHDTTDYPEAFETVPMQTKLRQRHYEVQIEESVMKLLRERARRAGIPVSQLVSNILRDQLASR